MPFQQGNATTNHSNHLVASPFLKRVHALDGTSDFHTHLFMVSVCQDESLTTKMDGQE